MAKQSPLKSKSYLKKRDLFLDSSKLLFAQVTDIFDFLWPTIAGMWNLRWQVNGYLLVHPNASDEELRGRFTKGSGYERANLKRACKEHTWQDQQDQFAKFLLVNAFAIYESWIFNIMNDYGITSRALEINLQTKTNGNNGIRNAIISLQSPISITMQDLFYTQFSSNPRNDISNLDNLMICYRCFKELRNCIMHRGSIVDQKYLDAYGDYNALTETDLNVAEKPIIDTPIIGTPTSVNLRGVVGFYEIIIKIAATVDAEISISEASFNKMIEKWRKVNGRRYSLKSNPTERALQVNSLFHKIEMPKPMDIVKAETLLRSHSLVS